MRVYLTALPEGSEWFGTQEAAFARARDASRRNADDAKTYGVAEAPVTVEQVELVPMTKDNVLAILNSRGGSCVASSVVVGTFLGGRARAVPHVNAD